MMKIKKISSKVYGTVNVIVEDNNRLFFKLKDISRLFSINMQNAHVEIGNNNVHEVVVNNKKNIFIDIDGVAICLRLSEDEKADQKYEWLKFVKDSNLVTVYGYKIEDLEDPEIKISLLNRLKELELKVAVYDVKIEEDSPKVDLVDKLYGTQAPIDMSIVTERIKYSITMNDLLEDLRNA